MSASGEQAYNDTGNIGNTGRDSAVEQAIRYACTLCAADLRLDTESPRCHLGQSDWTPTAATHAASTSISYMALCVMLTRKLSVAHM